MSLLLVFRTNAAFARFCNAADSFADVLASTGTSRARWRCGRRRVTGVRWRGCARPSRGRFTWAGMRCVFFVRADVRSDDVVFCSFAGIHGTPEASEELETVLTPAQLARLDLAGNVPAQLMTEITRALDRMNEHRVELIYQLLMDNDLTALHAYAAKTDRIAQVSESPFHRAFPVSRFIMHRARVAVEALRKRTAAFVTVVIHLYSRRLRESPHT